MVLVQVLSKFIRGEFLIDLLAISNYAIQLWHVDAKPENIAPVLGEMAEWLTYASFKVTRKAVMGSIPARRTITVHGTFQPDAPLRPLRPQSAGGAELLELRWSWIVHW